MNFCSLTDFNETKILQKFEFLFLVPVLKFWPSKSLEIDFFQIWPLLMKKRQNLGKKLKIKTPASTKFFDSARYVDH